MCLNGSCIQRRVQPGATHTRGPPTVCAFHCSFCFEMLICVFFFFSQIFDSDLTTFNILLRCVFVCMSVCVRPAGKVRTGVFRRESDDKREPGGRKKKNPQPQGRDKHLLFNKVTVMKVLTEKKTNSNCQNQW